jgi:hypothetical protein
MATLAEQIARLQEAHELAVVETYTRTDTPVKEILAQYNISYNKLYRILHTAKAPLRQPQRTQIIVLDHDNADAPTLVDRTPATIELRDRQIEVAYYVRQEIVAHICNVFHISWRTLYRICPPNRRKFVLPSTSSELDQHF